MDEPLPISAIVEVVGSLPKLAAVCGVDKSTPYSWTRVPPAHVPAVARATGIPAHKLRPDLPQLFAPQAAE